MVLYRLVADGAFLCDVLVAIAAHDCRYDLRLTRRQAKSAPPRYRGLTVKLLCEIRNAAAFQPILADHNTADTFEDQFRWRILQNHAARSKLDGSKNPASHSISRLQ